MSTIIDENPLLTSMSNPYFISETSRGSLQVEDLANKIEYMNKNESKKSFVSIDNDLKIETPKRAIP